VALFRNFLGDIANPFFAEVIIRGNATATGGTVKPILNVFHFRRLTNSSPADFVTFLSNFTTLFQGPLLACLNERYNMEQTECRPMDDPAAATVVQPISEPGALGNAASAYDLLSAVVYQMKTGFRGRSFKGSKHFSGLDESQVTGDELTAAAVTATWDALTAAFTAAIAGISDGAGNTFYPIILSPTLSSLGPTDIPGVFTGADVSSVLLNLTVGSMRRRKEKTVVND